MPNLLTTMLVKNIPSSIMMGTEQSAQVSLLTEIGVSIKFSVGIAHPFRTHAANQNEPTIQPNLVHSNQATGSGHIYWDYSPLRSLDSGTDV